MDTETNLITAVLNIIKNDNRTVGMSDNYHNRLHAMGEPLEEYIKDAFAGTINSDVLTKINVHSTVFSYGGGKNNPPDAIIDNGDAIEVKKVESIGQIPLNSSYPKSKLHNDDPRISSECSNIEGGLWREKDIIYTIGCVKAGNKLSSLALVYGDIYCAHRTCYEKLFDTIKDSISSTNLDLEETNELAHINAVDPLGITYFRARGMWGIDHPFKVFDYIYKHNSKNNFEMMAIIPKYKFESFANKNLLLKEYEINPNLMIKDCKVKDPNNTVKLIDVKLITYTI